MGTLLRADDLIEKLRSYTTHVDEALVRRAYRTAEGAHHGQRRKSGDPYFVHPLAVSSVITELKLDVPSVCAGLLHDCVEDTAVTLEVLGQEFGPEIAQLVDGVTKLGKIPWHTREERQAENFRKMLIAMARDIRVILIKLADRLDNMRTLEHHSADGQDRIARETMDIYAPIANRLGIYWLRAELEDLAFRYLYPAEFRQLVQELAASDQERKKYIHEVEATLREILSENQVQCEVNGRPKNLWGLYAKMRRTNRSLDQIHDAVAFRIVTSTVRDCYTALGVVHEHFTPIPGRFKDYIAMPKPNQYQSLHTSLIGPGGGRMEVQIRTLDMHRVADEGIAAHWVYKEGKSLLSPEEMQKFSWLRQLVEIQTEIKDPAEFIDAVKVDLFSDEVYVFTPAGDVKAFPTGATPVDFAYSVHSEVGNRCSGAKVNGLIVPLKHQLKNGDTVEIITSPSQKPSKDWLKFTVTARARAKIRHFIRGERRERSRALGKEMLDRECRKYGASLGKLQRQGALKQAAEKLKQEREDELLMQIGFGKILPLQVVQEMIPDVVATQQAAEPSAAEKAVMGPLRRIFTRSRRRDTSGIRVQGEEDVLVRFAHCCSPLPGDAIVGFITRGRGVTVHKLDCAKALDLDPERRIDVDWNKEIKVEHPVTINVQTTDRPGLLAEISRSFSEQGVNISQANCRAIGEGRAVNTFHFHVRHLDHLKQVMRLIQKIKGVYGVERV